MAKRKITPAIIKKELTVFWDKIEKLKQEMIIYTENLNYNKDREIFWKFFKSLNRAKESLVAFQYRVNENKHRLDKMFKK